MNRAAPAIVAGGVALGGGLVWWLNRRRILGAVAPSGGDADRAKEGADLLARMLVVEVGELGNFMDRAGMAWVALNRSQKWGAPLRDVLYSRVQGRSEFGSGCKANPLCEYNRRLDAAHTSSAYPASLRVGQLVMWGVVPSPIGRNRLLFIHPTYRAYQEPSPKRPVRDPETGLYLPVWSIAREDGGQAPTKPVTLGAVPTRFT
jgi:hypothetical protein